MKPGPIIAMVALIFVGMWLVLMPALSRESYDIEVRVGSKEIKLKIDEAGYEFIAPPELAKLGVVSGQEKDRVIQEQLSAWNAKPAFERRVMGFFNISKWTNFAWVAVGLIGQAAFFGRMFVQWVVSEKSKQSQVPEIFWWFSFVGGIFLFTYFVWRVDVVGVLGQSTGIVIYARNLRLIHKQKRRGDRQLDEEPAA
jgi:lipid-A-disaccharide synthase-like uncharacterized protein